MSNEKDIFNDLIRERLNKLEVPYNEEHWTDMSQKLDQLGPLPKPGKPWYFKGLLIAGASALVATAVYLAIPNDSASFIPTKELINQNDPATESQTDRAEKVGTESNNNHPIQAVPEVLNETIHQPAEPTLKPMKTVEDKVNTFADRSENSVKDKAKEEVDHMVQSSKENMPPDPKINNPALRASIVIKSTALCAGSPVEFGLDREQKNVSYYWEFGDKGLKSKDANPVHTFNRPGTFEVYVLISKKGEEKNDYKATYKVTIEAAPEANISIEPKDLTFFDAYVEVSCHSNVPCSYIWTFNEKEMASGKSASFYVAGEGQYPVTVIATGNNGCSVSASKFYNAPRGGKIPVGNTFTPNGDQLNAEFLPIDLQNTSMPFTFVIQDPRNGNNVVFESQSGNTSWNGNLNNTGNAMPEGQYFWFLSGKDVHGVERTQQGKILLKRP